MKTIAVFGATGRTGGAVVVEALRRGYAVRALARDPSRLGAAPGLRVTAGDARDAAAVAATIAGSDAVLCCLGMHDISVPATDFSDAVRTIVQAAAAAGVRRAIAIASAGVLPDPRGGLRFDHGVPPVLVNVAAEHRRNLAALASSGLDWTLMCPVDLHEDIPPGRARRALDTLPPGSGETGIPDLAIAMLDLVDDRASIGHRVGIVSLR